MVDVDAIREILKTEYGIQTMSEFRRAFENLKPIDISPFCAPIHDGSEENRSDRRCSAENIQKGEIVHGKNSNIA